MYLNPDGNYLFFRASTEKTIEGIRRLSAHDAEAYPEFLHFFDRASEILNPILWEEPPSVSDLAARFQGKDEEIYRYLMFGNLYDMLAEKVGKISPRENATEKRLARSIQSHSLINPAYREVKTGGGSYACGLWPERPGIRFPH